MKKRRGDAYAENLWGCAQDMTIGGFSVQERGIMLLRNKGQQFPAGKNILNKMDR